MTQIEQIKAEIERLIKQTELRRGEASADGARETLYWLKDFIESLEKERDVDLEKEIVEMMAKQPFFIKAKDQIAFARHFYELGCRHTAVLYDDMEKERQRRQENEPTIKGWVARDKDGQLGVYDILPIRGNTCWYPQVRFENWVLPENAFPDLKWEDEPIEVELIVNRV